MTEVIMGIDSIEGDDEDGESDGCSVVGDGDESCMANEEHSNEIYDRSGVTERESRSSAAGLGIAIEYWKLFS